MTAQPNQPEDTELRDKIKEAQSDLAGRRATHLQVGRMSGWTARELDGVHEGDQIIFENDILKLIEAEASRREQAAEIKGAYFAASSILLEMSPLMVHRMERGFPEMTAEVIGKTYEAVKKEMQPYQAKRQALTEKEIT